MSTSSLTIIAITTAVAGKENELRMAQEKLVSATMKESGCLRYGTIAKKPDSNPSDQKLSEKKQRDLLRRERIRKFSEQLGFFEHDDVATTFPAGSEPSG
jgi:quinol monooxygenase YgiN